MFYRSLKENICFWISCFGRERFFLFFFDGLGSFFNLKKKTVIIILSMGENWKIMFNFIQAFLSSNV